MNDFNVFMKIAGKYTKNYKKTFENVYLLNMGERSPCGRKTTHNIQ